MWTRLATDDDAQAMRAIYNAEVVGSTVTFDMVARTLEDQLDWLAEHRGAHPCIVAVDDDAAVAGFASVSPYRSRPAYSTTVEDSVYVRADLRGQGVGRLLLGDLVTLAGAHGFHAIMARIVDGHGASIALHRACGFELVGVEREVGRKFSRWLDVALMQRLLSPGPVGSVGSVGSGGSVGSVGSVGSGRSVGSVGSVSSAGSGGSVSSVGDARRA